MRFRGADERAIWIAIMLVGSLLEAAYMFGWFKQATRATATSRRSISTSPDADCRSSAPRFCWRRRLRRGMLAGAASLWLFAPLAPALCSMRSTGCPAG